MSNEKQSDSIEIPIGKYFSFLKVGRMRENPWVPATFVLAIALILVLVFSGAPTVSGGATADEAANNIVSFINSQGTGTVSLVEVSQTGSLYQVVVDFEGQEVPVYVTLDGEYLVSDRIPITGAAVLDTGSAGSGNTGQQEVVNVDIESAPSLGSVDAPVTIVEFSDYQCPFCQRHYQQTYSQIKENYIDSGMVRYVMMDFPLNSIHPEAQGAAEAAHCVRDQLGDEAYFEYHDVLFENQQTLSEANYILWAGELGVSGTEFTECLDSGKFADLVNENQVYGQQLGITGTPGFFINGKLVSGAQPYSVFEQAIEAELS